MTDLFTDYKKQHRSKKTFTIVAASLVLAVSVNAFLFKTDSGVRLQTSVINSGSKPTVAQKADVEIVNAGTGTDMLKLRANSNIDNMSGMDFSLAFDPEAIEISNVFSENKDMEISSTSNVPGMAHMTVLIKSPQKITSNSDILSIVYKKKKSEKTTVNLIETKFKSKDGTVYELLSKSTEF